MTSETPLLALTRTGGRAPKDNERLVIDGDGSFEMWRTVGWERVGSFSGRLDAATLTALSAAVDQLPPGDATADVPRGAAVEEHVARDGTATASMGGSTDPPAGWTAVVELVRQLLDDLTSASHARATLELRVDSPRTATLSVVGREPLAIAPESLRWHVEHLDRDGVPIATWTPPGPEGGEPPEVVMPAELQPQSPGVVRELALDHGWSLGDGDMVRVWATITTADPDDANGVPRTARLVAVAP